MSSFGALRNSPSLGALAQSEPSMLATLRAAATYAWCADSFTAAPGGATGNWVDVVSGVTATASGAPTVTTLNGRKAALFSGAQYYRTAAFASAIAQPFSVVAAVRATQYTGASARAIVDNQSGDYLVFGVLTATLRLFHINEVSTTLALNTNACIVSVLDGASSYIRLNGGANVAKSTVTTAQTGVTIGADRTNAIGWIGPIAMLAIVSGANYAARAEAIESQARRYYRI